MKLNSLFESSARIINLSSRLLYGCPTKYQSLVDFGVLHDSTSLKMSIYATWPFEDRLTLTFDPEHPTRVTDTSNEVSLTGILPLLIRPDVYITIHEWKNKQHGDEYAMDALKKLKFASVTSFAPFFTNPADFDMASDDMEDFIDLVKDTIKQLAQEGLPYSVIFGSSFTMGSIKQTIRDILAKYKQEFLHTHTEDFSKHSIPEIFSTFNRSDFTHHADVPVIKEIKSMIEEFGKEVTTEYKITVGRKNVYGIYPIDDNAVKVAADSICKELLEWIRLDYVPEIFQAAIKTMLNTVDDWVVKEVTAQGLKDVKWIQTVPIVSLLSKASSLPSLNFSSKALEL